MVSSGSRVATFVWATGASISDDSVSAAVTTGAGSRATGAGSAAVTSGVDLLATAASAVLEAIGVGLSADAASAASNGARWSTIDAAPVLSIPAEPIAANASTEAGMATSRHNAAIAANRGFMITVSNRAGLHRQACGADDFGALMWTSNGGKSRYLIFNRSVAQLQRGDQGRSNACRRSRPRWQRRRFPT